MRALKNNKEIKHKLKRVFAITSMLTVSMMINGCGTGLTSFVNKEMPQKIQDKADANITIAAEFNRIGAISDKQLEKITAEIQKQANEYKSTGEDGASSIAKAVTRYEAVELGGISHISYVDDDGVEWGLDWDGSAYVGAEHTPISIDSAFGTNKDGSSLADYYIGNYFAAYSFNKPSEGIHDRRKGGEGAIEPIEFFGEETAKMLNQVVRAPIYVLREDIITDTDTNDIDGVIAKVQEAVNNPSTKEQQALLNNYFKQAKNDENEPIYLVDPDDKEFNIIDYSKPLEDMSKNGIPGYDLSIGQCDKEDAFRVSFYEFNADAIDKLNSILENETYLLVRDADSSWKAYLMEYPVYTVSKFNDNKDGTVDVDLIKSGIGINLKTKQFVKYNTEGDSFDYDYNNAVRINAENYYYTLDPSENNSETGLTSFVVKGYDDLTGFKNVEGEELQATTARIILRDYLEVNYSPEFVTDENLVAFGRKMRLDMSNSNDRWIKTGETKGNMKQFKLQYNKNDKQAISYVDRDGILLKNVETQPITVLANTQNLLDSDYSNNKMISLVESGSKPDKVESSFDNRTPTASTVARETVDTAIEPLIMFPSDDLATVDFESDSDVKQRLYGLTVKQTIFDNGLFSDWINSKSQEASLDWWTSYLKEANFSYAPDHQALNGYLEDKYAYELSQSGIVILDLRTVADIQEIYNEKHDRERTSIIHTAFIMFGWLIISYSVLLMIAWVIDANLDIGIKLLDKMTFGNWVAVKYEEDIPYQNTNDQTYLDSKKMFVRAIILITVGIILINANILNILLGLIKLFGTIGIKIEGIIKGFK